MVVFDILDSHHRMTRWHEACIEDHLAELADLQRQQASDGNTACEKESQLPAGEHQLLAVGSIRPERSETSPQPSISANGHAAASDE